MAKNTQTNPYEEMLSMLSDEERAALSKMTGQDNSGSGTKTPIVKINYRERAAQDGTKIAKGNFCVGQKNTTVDGKTTLATAGTDLGNELSAVILKVGQQFSFWDADMKKRCSSQVICERGEVPTGYNLKHVCNDRSCPRRKEGIDKTERCSAQFVVYLRLPDGTKLPDGTDCPVAMMYVKGTSYKPFQTYMDTDLKGIPSIALTSKFKTTEEEQGSTLFYVLSFEKGKPVPTEVFKQNFSIVSGLNSQLIEFKEAQAKKLLDSPKLANKDTDSGVVVVNSGDDSEIPW